MQDDTLLFTNVDFLQVMNFSHCYFNFNLIITKVEHIYCLYFTSTSQPQGDSTVNKSLIKLGHENNTMTGPQPSDLVY